MLAPETTHPPYSGGSTSIAGTDPGYVYDPSATNAPGAPSEAADPDDSVDVPDTDAPDTVVDITGSPARGQTTDEPAPLPNPPVATLPQNPSVTGSGPGPSPSASSQPSPTPRPPGPIYFEAESPTNTLTNTRTYSCAPCSGGKKVGNIGLVGGITGTAVFNKVSWGNGGPAVLVISYVNGDTKNRTAQFSVNGAAPITISFAPTGDWDTVKTVTVKLTLRPGANQVKLTSLISAGPDLDMITVRAQ